MTCRMVVMGATCALSLLAFSPLCPAQYSSRFNAGESQTSAAGRQVHEAQLAAQTAQRQFNALRNKARLQLESRPQWKSVQTELHRAQIAFEAEKKAALSRVQQKPQYQTLRKEREAAQEKLASADAGETQITEKEIQDATAIVFDDGLKMEKIKDQALADDPKYADAKARLAAAQDKLQELDQEVTSVLQNDPEYQQATQQLESARQQVAAARQQLAQAAEAERQARIQEEKSRQHQNSAFGR